jgi:hypothetical protein
VKFSIFRDYISFPIVTDATVNFNGTAQSEHEIPDVTWRGAETQKPVSLLRALHTCFGIQFYSVGILKLVSDVAGFMGPLLLNKLVTFIQTKSESLLEGYLYAVGLCAVTLIGTFSISIVIKYSGFQMFDFKM